MATLGISTNTRLLGLGVIKQNRLVDYSIHLHKLSWSPSKANLILASLEPCVSRYSIKRVVLSIPYAHHQTEAFKHLIVKIRAYFEAKQIPVYTQTVEALHQLYPLGKKKSKKILMHALTLKYPELTLCYKREMRNKRSYYMKVFEAVAVAAIQEQM